MGRGERVTWRLELPGAWGGRLDPAWLPTGGTESWRRVFEGEDLAARVFSAGGAGLRWAQLAAAPAARDHGWTPAVDTALRLAAFAAEDSVATLCAAAATGHTGPDVLSSRLLCKLGLATHRMILEYRTLVRAAWTDLDACGLGAVHDADAEAQLTAVPAPAADGPGGPWRHALLVDGCAAEVSVHAGLPAAAASVAAQRAVDEHSIRWAEPVAAAPHRPLH